MLLFLLFAAVGFQQNWTRIDHWLHPPPPRLPGSAKVVLYATTWCGYCAKTRKFFAENQIAYQELDVENSDLGRRGYEALGGGGVPIVVVGDATVIRGYDPDAIGEALGGSP
jgi:glutaredoxin